MKNIIWIKASSNLSVKIADKHLKTSKMLNL
jgi:hypothetical protein